MSAAAANTAANANAANPNFGNNVPLYGTDLNGNTPLFSTPDLGGNFPLYTSPNPGVNAPLFSDPSVYGTRGNFAGTTNGTTPAVNAVSARCHSGIPVGEWLLYPSLRSYTQYSNNYFLTPSAPLSVGALGLTPALTAEWTNGIHTTTFFGNVDAQYFPTDTSINTFNQKVTLTQKYSPLPDLSFSAAADYTHQTINSALTNSIPTAVNTLPATTTLLPNGNVELPNGNIVAPNGQVIGNVAPTLSANGVTFVNPSNQYTANASVTKIFNGAILSLNGSVVNTDYQSPQGTGSSAFTSINAQSVGESGSIALGPLFYAYSNGTFTKDENNAAVDSITNSYRVLGGLGTRQFDMFRLSGYFGYQGSNSDGSSSTAGGTIYGGTISYFPTYIWSIIGRFDQTNNLSSSAVASNLALTLPTSSPVQIPITSSTRISTPSLQTTYQLTPQWSLLGNLSFSHIEYVGGTGLTDAWFASITVAYEIWRNMTLSAQYQYTDVASNIPGSSAQRSLVLLSAEYRF